MGKLTKLIKTTGWITVGITAIAVEQTVKAGKHIHNEVKSGRPQDLVREHCKSIKDKMSTVEQRGEAFRDKMRKASMEQNPDEVNHKFETIKEMFGASASKA